MIKFTPLKVTQKGHVTLSCWLVLIKELTMKLDFCVMDTWIAIMKDKLNLIFDMFCLADGSMTCLSDPVHYCISSTDGL